MSFHAELSTDEEKYSFDDLHDDRYDDDFEEDVTSPKSEKGGSMNS